MPLYCSEHVLDRQLTSCRCKACVWAKCSLSTYLFCAANACPMLNKTSIEDLSREKRSRADSDGSRAQQLPAYSHRLTCCRPYLGAHSHVGILSTQLYGAGEDIRGHLAQILNGLGWQSRPRFWAALPVQGALPTRLRRYRDRTWPVNSSTSLQKCRSNVTDAGPCRQSRLALP